MIKQILLLSVLLAGWSTLATAQLGGWDPRGLEKAEETIEDFLDEKPDLDAFFEEAYGYVVFPSIGKGGAGIGGAHGRGTVFEQGQPVGEARLTQVTFGFQFGGQAYAEIIFFQTEADLQRFKESRLELAAQASAVAIEDGASTNVAYQDGVAVFTMTKGGLMYEASIGGQKFKFKEYK
jgi:lipid-binding SYLF domain-containing protein